MEENIRQTAEDPQQRIVELEKTLRKKEREIGRLRTAIDQEKIYANAKANLLAAHTLAQRVRDRYLQLLLDNSLNIIICFDQNLHIIFCSKTLLRLIGTPADSECGKKIEEFLKDFCEDEVIAAITSSLFAVLADNESRSIPVHTSMGNRDIKRKYIINFIPMTSSESGNEGVMAIFQDVTDIESAREAAEHASAAKSEFLSNMSHEMRTPLNAIVGMTAIALEADNIERKEYCLKKIDNASSHLLGVINDILDMSKIEANKLELSCESFDFEKTIHKIVNVIHFRVDEKRQNFYISLDEAIPRSLKGDDQRLAQVVTNLLSNAVKFTPEEGSIRLFARLVELKNGVHTVQIEVSDTGIGISAEQQSRLFSSFQQADSSTSRKFGGTGLGLAISKRLVEMMGGRIWIESEPGNGATVAFTFRAEQGDGRNENMLSRDESFNADLGACEKGDKKEDFSGFRILLVEDVEINREIVVALLEPTGLTIDCAENGMIAVKMFEEAAEPYDMIFMDLQMPEMDGFEATRKIREFESIMSEQNVPIIAMTANVFREDIVKCLEAGMDSHVGKPLDIEDVMGKLRNYLLQGNAD